jgi:thiamine monophosphate kinase|tara:strand:+ start:915 stop:1088 length:174 start_codon:yes stop_codon:yes gene_type:complete
MKNQLQSLKSELKFIDHFLNGWEDYKIQKNIKPTEANKWKSMEDYRDKIASTITHIQ